MEMKEKGLKFDQEDLERLDAHDAANKEILNAGDKIMKEFKEDCTPERKKIPTAVFILILLIGFMCLAGAAVWIESKHNQCIVDLNKCAKECIKIPQEELEGGEWYGKYIVGT